MQQRRRRFQAEWIGPFEGWSKAWVAKNRWRVAELYTFDDAMQECGLVFAQCRQHYFYVDNAAWFMSLYQRAVRNRFIDMSRRSSRYRRVDVVAEVDCPGHHLPLGPLVVAAGETVAKGESSLDHVLAAYLT